MVTLGQGLPSGVVSGAGLLSTVQGQSAVFLLGIGISFKVGHCMRLAQL